MWIAARKCCLGQHSCIFRLIARPSASRSWVELRGVESEPESVCGFDSDGFDYDHVLWGRSLAGIRRQPKRRGSPGLSSRLKRDGFRSNRHRALVYCLRMISAQTRSAFVARENRYTLFRIML